MKDFSCYLKITSIIYKKELSCSDQETYGRFTPRAWNLIKKAKLDEEGEEKLNAMIVTKTETIALDEAKEMLYE